jgi:hypothetical protein
MLQASPFNAHGLKWGAVGTSFLPKACRKPASLGMPIAIEARVAGSGARCGMRLTGRRG